MLIMTLASRRYCRRQLNLSTYQCLPIYHLYIHRTHASATHAVGVRLLQDDQLDVFAPFGLENIFAMVIRPNYALPNRETHQRKAARGKSVWPEVTIVPWH